MMDKLQNENKLSISAKLAISPTTLRYVQEAADTVARYNDMIKKWMDQPMKDLAKLAAMQKMQDEATKKALEMIPKIDLSWIQDSANQYRASQIMPMRTMRYVPPLVRNDEIVAPTSEKSKVDEEMVKAINRLAAAQEEANQLNKEASKKQTKDKKKADLQVLVLDKDGHLFIQAHPRKIIDLSKSTQPRKFLQCIGTEFVPTKTVIDKTGCKTDQAFYQMLTKLRRNIERTLGLKEEVIQNDPNLGYRLAPGYKFLNE